MRVNANHLAVLLNICDNVVDSNLGSSTSCGRNCDYRHCRLLCGSYALQGAYISELRVVDDDTDSLCGIHGRTAADSYKVISAALLERCNAGLNVFDRGVRLDIIVNLVSKTVFIQNVEYLLGNAELDEVGVGAYECLLECPVLRFYSDVGDCPCAMIRRLVEYKSVYHDNFSFLRGDSYI